MNNILISSLFLAIALSVHYSDALTCLSTAQGSGGAGTQITCSGISAACYKITTAPTAFPTGTGGLVTFTGSQFIVGDRGCLPTIGGAAASQTTSVLLNLAVATNPANIAAVSTDYSSWVSLLCSTSGTCCSTNNCNSIGSGSGRIEVNLATAFLSTAFMFISFINF